MRDALHCASGLAVLVWWSPSILLAVGGALAFSWGVDIRLRRAHRLLDAGQRGEAIRVYAAVQWDIGAGMRCDRGRRAAP